MTLLADDGTPIDAAYEPGPALSDGPAIVVAHGFTGALERPALRRVAGVLGRSAAVVTFSFRGHGRSGGRSTVGDREVLDLAAAVRWARDLGHRKVATVGFSMGGSVVLRHAALWNRAHRTADGTVENQPPGARPTTVCAGRTNGHENAPPAAVRPGGTPGGTAAGGVRTGAVDDGTFTGVAGAVAGAGTRAGAADVRPVRGGAGAGVRTDNDRRDGDRTADARTDGDRRDGDRADGAHPDAVIAVSAPARWYYRGTPSMRRLHWVVTRPAGRLVSRYGLRTRVAAEEWAPVPLSPVASIPLIAPTPLLIVHGDRDPYFPLDHPRSLAEAGDPASTELWIERGMGHAENAVTPELLARIERWALAHVTAPDRDPAGP
ncbi:alpha/beta fold hydrolase [Streptomyces pactum]|uniref:alpha/beta fold hydrolase n=1 Tax=Streptomyces pactum TaxID=68249 RepID=UPI0036FF004B